MIQNIGKSIICDNFYPFIKENMKGSYWLHEEHIRGFISSMVLCDSTQMARVLSPNVVWTIPGTSLVSGPARGLKGIQRRCKLIRDYNARLDIKRVLYGPYPDSMVAELRNTGIRPLDYDEDFIKFDEHVMMLFTFDDDGKIKSVDNFVSDPQNLEDYFQ